MVSVYFQRLTRDGYESYRSSSRPIDVSQFIYSRDCPRLFVPDGHHYCIIRAMDDDRIVGTVLYWHGHRGLPHTKIIDIEVHENQRGLGFGTDSLNLIIYEAREKSSIFVSLFVFKHRTAATHIYNKLGFIGSKQFKNGVSMMLPLF